MPGTVQATSHATFGQDVLEASRQQPVIVDFWAAWCGPCKSLAPILENLAREIAGQARVVKVDTDAEQELARQFQIRSIPTVMLFRDGKVASQFLGVRPLQAIREWLKPYLQPVSGPAASGSLEVLAEQALKDGDAAAARRHLDGLPAERQDSEPVRALRIRLAFAEELPAVAAGGADLDALYAEGLKAAAAGAGARAAAAFLTLTERSRAYRDDAGRRALIRLFDLVGAADPVAQEYRRKLGQLLH